MDDFIGGGRRGSSVPSISGYVAPLDGAPYRDEEEKKGKVGSEGGKGMNILGKMGYGLLHFFSFFLAAFSFGKNNRRV
jgi:hypothetical protein